MAAKTLFMASFVATNTSLWPKWLHYERIRCANNRMPTMRLMNNTGMHRVRRVCRVVLRAHEQDEHTGAELWEAKRHVEDCKSRTHRASHEQVKRAASLTIPKQ